MRQRVRKGERGGGGRHRGSTAERKGDIYAERPRSRNAESRTGKQRYREIDKHKDIQTERQSSRQVDRQLYPTGRYDNAGRPGARETEIITEIYTKKRHRDRGRQRDTSR